MLTKYIGKLDLIIVEHNGKKYCFTKKDPIKDVPTEVYNLLQRSNSVYIGDVIPYAPPDVKPEIKTEPRKPEQDFVDHINKEPKPEPKKRGRKKKGE